MERSTDLQSWSLINDSNITIKLSNIEIAVEIDMPSVNAKQNLFE